MNRLSIALNKYNNNLITLIELQKCIRELNVSGFKCSIVSFNGTMIGVVE